MVDRKYTVSVPIRGLFNLTLTQNKLQQLFKHYLVSVPIRGLFNLTVVNLVVVFMYM